VTSETRQQFISGPKVVIAHYSIALSKQRSLSITFAPVISNRTWF